ncbi:hypothetical protein [Xenorhabdus nematophila]|uniref:hypothetical protein n=1 Tax=Xenorhabdus nematophila TaxID=628 RepID=UPI0005709E81|nr:hypothetical protein [Xenorhabdus nematophila]KHD27476.1 hypothetical protein LH67_17790 [Xenorhabdus nematophila]
MDGDHPEYGDAWFYALEISEDALGRLQYELVFYDSRGQPMSQSPARQFICDLVAFKAAQSPPLPLSEGTICYVDETIPDGYQVRNLITTSSPFPPITDSHHYWTLLSHYSASPLLLYSADALKHFFTGVQFLCRYRQRREPKIAAHERGYYGIKF